MDEDADARVAGFLKERGHVVDFVRDVLGRGSPDLLVATAANDLGAIVVTRNYRHFRKLIRREPEGTQPRFPRAGLICFRCDDASAMDRIRSFIGNIEAEFVDSQQRPDPRLIVEITEKTLSLIR